MYYQYWQDLKKMWWWHLRAANHEIIAHGESYHNEADCLHAIALVKASKDAPINRAYLS